MELVTISEVTRRLNQATVMAARLKGEADSALRRSNDLETKVGLAKGRLALADEVTTILDNLRDRAHSRSVGAFETALSGILADLFPDKGDVVLGLSTERGAPALDISIRDGADTEDVMEGSGGAVTNVISTGLQYAALSRTKNRRLMVLDEPDCWIQPELIRNFVKVIADVSKEAKTQTFLISHHPYTLFEGLTTVVKLTQDATGAITASPLEPVLAKWESNDEPGIRYIEMTNFGPHVHTRIDFGPGVTSLVGKNDLGKSKAIAGSLRAVAYGDSDDRMIRRGTTEAKIIIGLESGRRIEWLRKLKGNPKVMYSIYEDGNDKPTFEGKPPARGEVPEAVTKLLNITRVDQLDVQISAQKDPVFLLNETPSTRAQLLSVGRESGHLVAWFDTYKDWQRTDKDTVKTGELEYGQLKTRLTALNTLDSIEPVLTGLAPLQEILAAASARQNILFEAEMDIESGLKQTRALGLTLGVLDRTPELPILVATAPIAAQALTLEQLMHQAAVVIPDLMVQLPELYPTDRVVEVGKALVGLQGRVAAYDTMTAPVPDLPTLHALDKLETTSTSMNQAIDAVAKADTKVLAATTALTAAETELETLKASFGNRCPVCDTTFPDKGIEHSHA